MKGAARHHRREGGRAGLPILSLCLPDMTILGHHLMEVFSCGAEGKKSCPTGNARVVPASHRTSAPHRQTLSPPAVGQAFGLHPCMVLFREQRAYVRLGRNRDSLFQPPLSFPGIHSQAPP